MANMFKIGDTVTLKSGGPVMTVHSLGNSIVNPGDVECIWFEGVVRHEAYFHPDTLNLYNGMHLG